MSPLFAMKRALPLTLSLLASIAVPGTFAADAGSFNILTFNVAGLPEILSSNDVPGDKTTNSRTIGAKFAEYGYDVIHVQEVSALSSVLDYPAGIFNVSNQCADPCGVYRISITMLISMRRTTTRTGQQRLEGFRLGVV